MLQLSGGQQIQPFPEAWYEEPLTLNFGISPYWIDTVDVIYSNAFEGHATRAALTNVHYYFGFFFLQGYLWHAIRALGFDFRRVTNAVASLDAAKVTLNG